jgi:pimeloyl-ACP methyl ester carboxylesterase
MSAARTRDAEVNGVRLSVTEQGEGPLVLLCHGWPEIAHSWRHQMPALAAAGFHAAAPDMRGFGASDAPAEISAYSILHLVGDAVGLVSALGHSQAVIVGHDWGAPVAWTSAMLRPDVFTAVVGMSVPHRSRGPAPPMATLRAAGIERFYWQYFQEPGVAERELEADPARTMRRILAGGFGPRAGGVPMMLPEGGGFLDTLTDPERLPGWLDEEALAVMARAYEASGFRGGLNYYRNLDRNWELTAAWDGALIRQPALFVAGSKDAVITGMIGAGALKHLPKAVPGLRRSLILEGAGHWIQQERAVEVNAALLEFLADLPAPADGTQSSP